MFGALMPFNRGGNGTCRRNNPWSFSSIIDDFFSNVPNTDNYGIRTDIRDVGEEYVVEADIPGVKKKDIKLDLKDDILTISVEYKEETKDERDNYIRRERRYGSFGRSFNVANVNQDKIKAKYDNGVLTINLPKAEDVKDNRRAIDIQ